MDTNLDPKYLRTDTAKRLLDASYQLEALTQKASIERIMSYKTNEQVDEILPMTNREKFVETIKQGIVEMPNVFKEGKRQLKLAKEVVFSKLRGPKLTDKYRADKQLEIEEEL